MSVSANLARLAALGALVVACAKVPYTQRTQYNLIPDGLMRGLGKSTYADMLAEVQVRRQGEDAVLLGQVGERVARAAREPQFDWEFSLIDSPEVNAWCLPGGYIGFYTGILPALQNEAGMAFVMGHEVGHATARHGAERMTQQLSLIGGLAGIELFMANRTSLEPKQRAAILGALGVGATFGVLLPFSRSHETEADIIGMMYMADAGYPPAESIEVWNRMDSLSGGASVPAFLSTHPSHAQRQERLREWLPRALKRYQRNALSHDTLRARWTGGGIGGGGSDAGGGGRSRP